MTTKKKQSREVAPSEPPIINPDAWYTRDQIAQIGLASERSLVRAERDKWNPLKAVRTGKYIRYRGQWLIDWMEQRAA